MQEIVEKLLNTAINKNGKHSKIVMLAMSKLNHIQSKIFAALVNSHISHEDFLTIIIEEKNIES